MPSVILICGKICSGKSTLAAKLREQENAVILSCDELVLQVLGAYLGDRHEEITSLVQKYLRQKAVEIVRAGCSVILEWGFWTRESRKEISSFLLKAGVPWEWIFLNIPDDRWHAQIKKRNAAIRNGQSEDYYIDEALLRKAETLFDEISEEEMETLKTEYCIHIKEYGMC